MGAVIWLTVAPFKIGSSQVVGDACSNILPIMLHHRIWLHLLDDVIELVSGDASFGFLKVGGHIQVAHLSQLLLAGSSILVSVLGSKTLGSVVE